MFSMAHIWKMTSVQGFFIRSLAPTDAACVDEDACTAVSESVLPKVRRRKCTYRYVLSASAWRVVPMTVSQSPNPKTLGSLDHPLSLAAERFLPTHASQVAHSSKPKKFDPPALE